MKLGLRVDVDSIRDCAMLPALLDLLKEYSAAATFFVATGRDKSALNLKRYAASGRLPRSSIMPVFDLLRYVERAPELKLLRKYEVGLHGYDHYHWMKNLANLNEAEIAALISKGIDCFEKAFGFKPRSFASPGFRVSEAYLRALDRFGFEYASDYIGENILPCFKTKQIPVCMKAFCEYSERELLELIPKLKQHSVIYIHPGREFILHRNLLVELFQKFTFTSLGEIARENTADL